MRYGEVSIVDAYRGDVRFLAALMITGTDVDVPGHVHQVAGSRRETGQALRRRKPAFGVCGSFDSMNSLAHTVGISRSGFSETIVPRTIHAPVRISAPPRSTMVPPFICKPAKSLTGPRTAITPRRILMPNSMPAEPSTRIVPPFMPTRLPR